MEIDGERETERETERDRERHIETETERLESMTLSSLNSSVDFRVIVVVFLLICAGAEVISVETVMNPMQFYTEELDEEEEEEETSGHKLHPPDEVSFLLTIRYTRRLKCFRDYVRGADFFGANKLMERHLEAN